MGACEEIHGAMEAARADVAPWTDWVADNIDLEGRHGCGQKMSRCVEVITVSVILNKVSEEFRVGLCSDRSEDVYNYRPLLDCLDLDAAAQLV
jgi:hypothetical protein